MKRIALMLFIAAAFAAAVNCQTLEWMMAGPRMERAARQAYAPVDFMINNWGYGGYYPYGGYGSGSSALTTGVAAFGGAVLGNIVVHAVTRPHRDGRDREYVPAPEGGRAYFAPNYSTPQGREVRFAQPKPAKPLDCRKPRGKRGKNEAACAAAEAEAAAGQQAAERQACLDQLAVSDRRLRNFSPVVTMFATVNGQPLMVCGEQVVLQPRQTVHIFPLPPGGQIGGYFFFAHKGKEEREKAVVRDVNRPGFTGFILAVPGAPAPEGRN